jgi:hypothetical protein
MASCQQLFLSRQGDPQVGDIAYSNALTYKNGSVLPNGFYAYTDSSNQSKAALVENGNGVITLIYNCSEFFCAQYEAYDIFGLGGQINWTDFSGNSDVYYLGSYQTFEFCGLNTVNPTVPYYDDISWSGGTYSCTFTFTRSGTFSRSCNCKYYTQALTYTKTYYSTVSYNDAYSQGVNDSGFTSEGQAYADTNGVCTLKRLVPVNFFSPNGDGINEYLDILEYIGASSSYIIADYTCYPNMYVTVFDRWSRVWYENTGVYTRWNGTKQTAGSFYITGGQYFQGDPAPETTYYYQINLNDGTGRTYSGFTTLLR